MAASPVHSSASAPGEAPILETVRRFWPLTAGRRRGIALLLALSLVGPVVETATIALFGRLVDDVLSPGDLGPLPGIAAAYVALALAGGVAGFWRALLSERVSQQVVLDLRLRLFGHLQWLPMEVFDRTRHGDILVRVTDDVEALPTLLVGGVVGLAVNVLKIVLFAGALVWIDPRLALVAAIVGPPFWWASRRFARRIKDLSREQRRRDAEATALAEESLANLPLVQAYNRQDHELARLRAESSALLASQMAVVRAKAMFSPLADLIELAGVLAVIGAGAFELSQGRISLGELLAFIAFLSQLYGPVRGVGKLWTSLASASASAERVAELLDERPRVFDPAVPADPAHAAGDLAVERVSYRYPGAARDALDGLDLRVRPGETVAVVGASGAGKSTLARLLLRFDDPAAGRIALGGIDLRDLRVTDVRDLVALLPQETMLFAGTVRDAIAFGRPGATDSEIEDAARRAGIHDVIAALPGGYGTRLGDKGRTLSGGQRQRIALARALLRDAPVLLLDEPTTGLDPETGARVLADLRAAAADRIVLLITHDLHAAATADRIVVLEDGRVSEAGTHLDLLARDGAYARFWEAARREEAEATPEPVRLAS